MEKRSIKERGMSDYHSLLSVLRYPNQVHMMLTPKCNSRCIYCPTDRESGGGFRNRYMPIEIVRAVVDDLAGVWCGIPDFVGWMWWSEGGEGTLHPEYREIIEYAYEKLRGHVQFSLVSNMSMVDEGLARFVLTHGFKQFHFNIDGAVKEAYEAVKRGMSYERNLTNIEGFLRLKGELAPDAYVNINVISYPRYMHFMYPKKEEDKPWVYDGVEDTTWKVVESLHGRVDSVNIQGIGYWAVMYERKKRRTSICPLIPSRVIHSEAMVSVDGDFYPCCMDYKCQVRFGNIMEQSITEIWNGERRHSFLRLLYQMRFEEIGEPCIYCQDPEPNL